MVEYADYVRFVIRQLNRMSNITDVAEDDDHDVAFFYKGGKFHVICDSDINFIRVAFYNMKQVTDMPERFAALIAMNEIAANAKVAKLNWTGRNRDMITINFENIVQDREVAFPLIIERILEAVLETRSRFEVAFDRALVI